MSRELTLIPRTAHGEVDWPAVQARYPFMTALEGCPQDPRYHAEGDVAIHTRMVVDQLLSDPVMSQLSAVDRECVTAAAVFHDCGKPCVTREDNGAIRSPGHAKVGARLLQNHWWRDSIQVPFAARRLILGLVRYHALPVAFMRPRAGFTPETQIIAASWWARIDLLTHLALADMRGRRCADAQDEIQAQETAAYFGEVGRELGCWDAPFGFGTDHARFTFFQSTEPNAHYQAFDDREFEVVVMAGLPGAGKDRWLAEQGGSRPMISLDTIRDELEIKPESNQGPVFQEGIARAKEHLRRKEPFIWNATNVTQLVRSRLISTFAGYGAAVRIVWIDASRRQILAQNRERERRVPEKVIDRLAEKMEYPDWTECHRLEVVETDAGRLARVA